MLSTVPTEVTEGAIEAIRQEGTDLMERVKTYRYDAFKIEQRGITETMFAKRSTSSLQQYRKIQLKEGELISYFLKVQRNKMSESESEHLQKLVSSIKNLTLAAKSIKSIIHTVAILKDGEQPEEVAFQNSIQEQFTAFYKAIENDATETDIELHISRAYRENVNTIYNMVENGILRKDELTSFLHLNSQIKQFKTLYWQSQEGIN